LKRIIIIIEEKHLAVRTRLPLHRLNFKLQQQCHQNHQNPGEKEKKKKFNVEQEEEIKTKTYEPPVSIQSI